MRPILIVLLGISGCLLGFFLPQITNLISANKCRKRGVVPAENKKYGSLTLKLVLGLLHMAVWALAGYQTGSFWEALLIALLFSAAVAVTLIDLRIRIIPNELVLTMLIAGGAFQLVHSGVPAFLTSLLCMVGMMAIFIASAAVTGSGAVGAGDVKLAGIMGIVLGYPHILWALLLMSVAIVIYTAAGFITRRLNMRSTFAFAPFMMFGMVFSMAHMVVT